MSRFNKNRYRAVQFKKDKFYNKEVCYIPLYETEVNGNVGFASPIYSISNKPVVFSVKQVDIETNRGKRICFMLKVTKVQTPNPNDRL